ncbi:MAG TPA: hypothetical protein DIT04_00995 [Dysgonomonas sp.]|nr:hypothetical protein [Dysgonomonas sp.]
MDNEQTINIKPLEFFLGTITHPLELVEEIDNLVYDYMLMYFKLESKEENVIEGKPESYLYSLKSLRDILKKCTTEPKEAE